MFTRSWSLVFLAFTAFTFAWSPSIVLAQDDDPFSDTSDDAFGDEDLFEEDDPFGAGNDPFGNADGFGDDDDPFGDAGEPKPEQAKRTRVRQQTPERVAHATKASGKRAGRSAKLSHKERLQRLGIYSVDPLGEKELRILETLQNEVSVAFEDDELTDVIELMAGEHGIPIVFDKSALEEE